MDVNTCVTVLSFLLVAVEFYTYMQKELMVHLCCQSVWGRFHLLDLLLSKMSPIIVAEPTHFYTFFFLPEGSTAGAAVGQTARSVLTPSR